MGPGSRQLRLQAAGRSPREPALGRDSHRPDRWRPDHTYFRHVWNVPTDESGLMTRYPSTEAYFDIGTGWDGREVPYEHVVAVTIWVHNVFDYINLFENGMDLRKLYEEDKLYEEN